MTPELQNALAAARTLPREQLPEFLGGLRQVEATAMARLLSATPASQAAPDALLNVTQAAERLGVSPGYLYRHHRQLPFARHVGRALRFSSLGIEQYIRQQDVLTPRRKRATLVPAGGTNETTQARH